VSLYADAGASSTGGLVMSKHDNQRRFIMAYLAEEDGTMEIESGLTVADMQDRIAKYRLTNFDYAIFEGAVIKDFGSQTNLLP
jgi:hypothetical protein